MNNYFKLNILFCLSTKFCSLWKFLAANVNNKMKSKMMHKWVYHTKKIVILCIFIGVAQINAQKLIPIDRAYVNELFTTKIEPKMFNWTLEHADQFDFRLSLKGYPDLPSWMRYMYSNEYHVGYMYGTPPERLSGQEVMKYNSRREIDFLPSLYCDLIEYSFFLFISFDFIN